MDESAAFARWRRRWAKLEKQRAALLERSSEKSADPSPLADEWAALLKQGERLKSSAPAFLRPAADEFRYAVAIACNACSGLATIFEPDRHVRAWAATELERSDKRAARAERAIEQARLSLSARAVANRRVVSSLSNVIAALDATEEARKLAPAYSRDAHLSAALTASRDLLSIYLNADRT